MNKFKNKFLRILLSFSLLTTLSLATKAKTKDDKLLYSIEFNYKGKDLEKDRNVSGEILNDYSKDLKNKTSAKEYVHFYAVMQKLFEKYKIPKEKMFKHFQRLQIMTPVKEKLKLFGDANVVVDFSEKKNFQNLIKNFNDDLKNINITKEDLKNAKRNLINEIKEDLEKLNNEEIKDFEGKNLTEMGQIFLRKTIAKKKELKEKILNQENITQNDKKILKSLEESMAEDIQKLKNKDTKKEGEWVSKAIEHYKNYFIPFKKGHIKQIKDVKYEDIKNLKEYLEIDLNKLEKRIVQDF